ncbi:MAG: Fic family protein, partial [Verrucomicrobiota bacterium]
LQPFEDVNKRVSRLAANISLVQRNLCPLSFTDVTQDDYVSALLGVYELNRVDYLRDLFLWAYRRSAERYGAIRQSLGAPDPFRLSHREEIGRIVGEVVREGLDKVAAVRLIREEAEKIVVERERARFMEEVERELTGLHLGSIARFRLRPKEFERWRVGWR